MNAFSILDSRFSIGGSAARQNRASSGIGRARSFEHPANPKSSSAQRASAIQNRK